MAETPDISKIIGVIMENPSIIEQISALAAGESRGEPDKREAPSPTAEAAVTSAAPPERGRDSNRSRLLCAMKPYLSKKRAEAIDSVLAIMEVMDMMKAR